MTIELDEGVALADITINRADLIEELAVVHFLERQEAKAVLDILFELIVDHICRGDTVKLPGLGNFSVRDKKARPGRNLRTGEEVLIEERRVISFHPSVTLNKRVTASLAQD